MAAGGDDMSVKEHQTKLAEVLRERDVVQLYLLSYLGHDERKHDQLLEDLPLIKQGLYKSA
jgi:hypothetical protein